MKPKPGRPAYEPDEKTRAQVKMLAAERTGRVCRTTERALA